MSLWSIDVTEDIRLAEVFEQSAPCPRLFWGVVVGFMAMVHSHHSLRSDTLLMLPRNFEKEINCLKYKNFEKCI
jgi:hypothetical protein